MMNNLKNFAIDMSEISLNFNLMRNATEMAVKAALSSALIIADQVMMQSKATKLYLKAEDLEIIVEDGNAMLVTKDFTIVSDTITLISTEYKFVDFPLHFLTALLDSLTKIGLKFQKGNAEFNTEFTSEGIKLATAFLRLFGKNTVKKHVNYQSHDILIDNGFISMDGKTLLQDNVFYYYKGATEVLIDLLHVQAVRDDVVNAPNKYSVLGICNE